jgi:serralysin
VPAFLGPRRNPVTTQRIEVCTDAAPPHGDPELLAHTARLVSERNAPDPAQVRNFASLASIETPLAAVMLTHKRWRPGQAIRIAFLDGSPTLRKRVRKYANRWLWDAGLKFQWISDPRQADVRITFTRGGSWSYLGTDNLTIAKDQPTMQFGWLTEGSDDVEVRRVVIHEFGHMLSLGHEQAHPRGEIPWDRPAVYEYYRRTQGWSPDQVERQVIRVYSREMTNFSRYDPKSIMHYAVPAELLTDPSRAVGWNTYRSALDREFIRRRYPGAAGDVDEEAA